MSSIDQIFKLADSSPKAEGVTPKTLGVKTTPKEERANLEELETAYIHDATINNGINKNVAIIMSAGYTIEGNEESVEFVENFLANVGKTGGNTEWEKLLEIIFKHQCVYGRAFNEIIYNVEGTKIVDLDFINPTKMDYAKDTVGKIVLDVNSNSVGWVETISYSDIMGGGNLSTDPAPKGVDKGSNQIFFKPERIASYKLYEIGDGFYGLGMIEPILKISKWKNTMFEALTNTYYRTAFPRTVFSVGDQFHEPTNELLERTTEALNNSSYKTSFALPNYVSPQILEPRNSDKLKEHVKQFIDEEVTVLGPKSFVTGSGDGTNKNTLSRQEFLYKLTLRDIVKRTVCVIEKQIFAKLAEIYDLPDVPRIVWGEINLEELDSKAERIVKYVNSNIVIPDSDLEAYIRKFEGLPEALEGGEDRDRGIKEPREEPEDEPEDKPEDDVGKSD